MTIEERAIDYDVQSRIDNKRKSQSYDTCDDVIDAYIQCAIDQRQIDIDKAWNWMMSHVCLHLGDKDSFIKAMTKEE